MTTANPALTELAATAVQASTCCDRWCSSWPTVPTLAIGAAHDTMDPARMRTLALPMPRGQTLHCPNGSHVTLYGDPVTGTQR